MLLDYLFKYFYEEKQMPSAAGLDPARFREMLDRRLVPGASYEVSGGVRIVSFVADHQEDVTCRFHLKAHAAWLKAIDRLTLDHEAQARDYFFDRYRASRKAFLASPLGTDLVAAAPSVPDQFNQDHADRTWSRFLEGVYGVCTRDGQPETVFLKQAGMLFIDELTRHGSGTLSPGRRDLLARTVALLDGVESDFAPHEVSISSRQRCILDIRARFLSGQAA